jgi:hypothetical protein
MTENTILATMGVVRAGYGNLQVRLPARPRVAGVVFGVKSFALKSTSDGGLRKPARMA